MNEKKTTLKELMEEGQVFAPCIYDALSAHAVYLAGYKAMLLSGGALAYSMCGVPDLGLLSPDELVWATTRITDTSPLPLIVDSDDGYGESPLTTYRLVQRLAKAGAMALSIDDSTGIRGWERWVVNKEIPFEHRVVSREIWLSKIKAALDACAGTDCMLIARTEAYGQYGSIDESIERTLLARELGAPITLLCGGMKTLEDAKKVAAADPGWKMWPDVGVTDGRPDVELVDIGKLGFNLVTMHYTEKGALFGMLDYGKRTIKDRNTVYIDQHDFDGTLPSKEHHDLLGYWKKWIPMEDEFNDLHEVNAKSYDIKYD